MRFVLLGLLIACGGSPKSASAPPPPPVEGQPAPPASAPPPVDQPSTIATNVPAPPPGDGQTRAPSMTGDPCEGGQADEGNMKPVRHGGGNPCGGGKSSVPTVAIGQPTAQGDLDKAIIRRYIKRNIQKIQYCYEKVLLAKPGLAGKIASTFTISPDGHVESSTATGFDPEVADCIAAVIKDIEFPKPKSGGKVTVNYPFVFSSAGN